MWTGVTYYHGERVLRQLFHNYTSLVSFQHFNSVFLTFHFGKKKLLHLEKFHRIRTLQGSKHKKIAEKKSHTNMVRFLLVIVSYLCV